MYDSLPYRNDSSQVMRRLMRSHPTRAGVMGVATCDKGLPAMMMALASQHDHPTILVPGGVMLAGEAGSEDTAKVQTIGARYAHGEITLEQAAEAGCHACASPGGGCQFLGTAATSQVIGEALGPDACRTRRSRRRANRSGSTWPAARPAHCSSMSNRGIRTPDILTDAAFKNALAVFAAFGGSTNLLLHTPAIAFHAGVKRPTIDDWTHFNRSVPRLVDALPNGPIGHPTIRVFLAGGVPEVMLHLRELGLLELDALTRQRRNARHGSRLVGEVRTPLAASRAPQGRATTIDPDTVIMSPDAGEGAG